MTREIQGLQWVRALQGRPECIPQGRPRGAKAQGVKYERTIAGMPDFAPAKHGTWFEFNDSRGHGYAQADFLFGTQECVVVGEAKLTWTLGAYAQLRGLYFPLLAKASGFPVGGFVVCQNVTRETPRGDVVGSVAEALAKVALDPFRIPVLHLPLLPKEPRCAKSTQTAAGDRVPSWWKKAEGPRWGSAARG